ncbi:hypothetical protein C6501_17955 [Candidatus Poribacteria bacterium]|nr:MAG: hypothetical protein C6501_17955 [Candidatus Poribacteria bacterium]
MTIISEKMMLGKVNEFQILNADDTELMRISQEGTLSLNLNEMQTIQTHFTALQRNPTDVELETIPRDLIAAIKRPVYVSGICSDY